MLLKDISSLTCPEGLSPHSIYILLQSYSRKQGIALLLLCLAPGSNLPTNALIYFQNRSGIHSLLSITKSIVWVCYVNYSKLSIGYNTLQIKCHLVRVTHWLDKTQTLTTAVHHQPPDISPHVPHTLSLSSLRYLPTPTQSQHCGFPAHRGLLGRPWWLRLSWCSLSFSAVFSWGMRTIFPNLHYTCLVSSLFLKCLS